MEPAEFDVRRDRATAPSSSREPLLQVEAVSKFFSVGGVMPWLSRRRVLAVDEVSFESAVGRTLSLVGESGCGKTTTAKLVLGLELPTSGRIMFKGREREPASKRRAGTSRTDIQAVFQDPSSALNPRRRIGQIIAEPLVANRLYSRLDGNGIVLDLLEKVGLHPSLIDYFPHELSGGMRQRVAIAQALAPEPALLVLDEPVSALDVSIRAQIMNLLKDLQDELGLSYLLIAHDLATVRYVSHDVAVMYLGRIVEYGPSEVIFRTPLHPYTIALISAVLSPRASGPVRERIILEVDVPSAADPPSGCNFHTRCWLRQSLGNPSDCVERQPELRMIEDRRVACHFAEDVPVTAVVQSPRQASIDQRPQA